MIFTDFEDLKTQLGQHNNPKIGWMLFEDKTDPGYLNEGYLNTLRILKRDCDIVVVDIVGFGMMLKSLYLNHNEIYKPVITISEYMEYFDELADHILYQPPYDQLARLREPSDIGLYKKRVNIYTKNYPFQYQANEMITKTFLTIFELYKFKNLPIHCSANMWKCGYRSFFYKDCLEKKLNINMIITDPIRDEYGLIPTDSDTYSDPENRELLININNKIQTNTLPLEEFRQVLLQHENVSEVYLFDGSFASGSMIEVLINIGNQKARIVNYFTNK